MRGLGALESRAAPQAPAVCGEVDKRGVAMLMSREGPELVLRGKSESWLEPLKLEN